MPVRACSVHSLLGGLLLAALVFTTSTRATCFYFTQEHVDLLGFVWNASSGQLALMADDDASNQLYASNECVVVCPESMELTLPFDMPIGKEGDVMWILPQVSPPSGVPFVGVSSERIPDGVFSSALIARLTRVEGPGHFLVWQAGMGVFNVVMDTRDGIGSNDYLTLPVGAHAHYNWGFTTNGVYRAYFQASGVRVGQSTNTVSPETPFTFHILPLRPFELWTATNWPCECATNIIAAGADPDGDKTANAFEYGTGTNPKEFTTNAWSVLSFVSTNSQTYGALTFNRAKAAPDATCDVVAIDSLTAPNWQLLTSLHSLVDEGPTERLTVRDDVPAGSATNRFYQLRVWLP